MVTRSTHNGGMGILRGAPVIGAAAIVIAMLAGCVPSTPELPRSATPEEIQALRDEQAREWWDNMASGDPMPDIEVIEEMPSEEAYLRQTQCLQDAAIPGVIVTDDGGWSFEGDVGVEGEVGFTDPLYIQMQQQAWICNQQFPAAGEDAYVLSASELAWLHDFYVQRYRPCLASLGFEAITFPSREQFIGEGVGYPAWVPHDYSVSPVPTRTQWMIIAERCPLPSLLAAYDLPGYGVSG